ncbi:oxidoreductase [Nocardioides sp. zg-536]|uniref:Oxidoreductase n=1 Tax=Nocardioides faecalis TaxID=2803858 RepID=A0A939BVI8_9ACTN|nr:PDR/VanB family oxidoreductase [Nocardioides faecalis]MBM9460001.1 oxidoreductase [Nocardioides faecalis]MBS4753131.1 oxidoreductase [Nocardioides faecalis]QVI58778.1 oxidoreductase [Nocardioides faecalis]
MRTGTERALVVLDRQEAAEDIVRITFGDPDGGPLPSWRPGAHVSLLLPDDVERQYSLCGDDLGPSTWTIAVLRDEAGRGGSRWVHENLHPGAVVEARGPLNHFVLGKAERYEMIAGGIGITPLLPMIAEVEAKGRQWRLSYAGRSRSTMAFVDELCERYPGHIEVYAADEGRRLDLPGLLGTPQPGTQVYACGPGRLIDEAEELVSAWPGTELHTERFAPRELSAPVRDEAFDVELIYSGQTITVQPHQSVLEAAEAAGAMVVASCREGTCGTCDTPVVMGEVDHRDSVLRPAERAQGDRMMICVSRAACSLLSLEL